MVIFGAEFWGKDTLLMKQNNFLVLKEKRKPYCIVKVWIEAGHCDVLHTPYCKMEESG
jgi:hypothetical protein